MSFTTRSGSLTKLRILFMRVVILTILLQRATPIPLAALRAGPGTDDLEVVYRWGQNEIESLSHIKTHGVWSLRTKDTLQRRGESQGNQPDGPDLPVIPGDGPCCCRSSSFFGQFMRKGALQPRPWCPLWLRGPEDSPCGPPLHPLVNG